MNWNGEEVACKRKARKKRNACLVPESDPALAHSGGGKLGGFVGIYKFFNLI